MERIEEILRRLVAIPSDTGTKKECDVEKEILKMIGEMSYFKEHSEEYGAFDVEGDRFGRSIIWALSGGKSIETIVLMHHHDVVDASDYGELSGKAYDMDEIRKALLKKEDMPTEVVEDLKSGEWWFGRGVADMKAGSAIQLATLERYTSLEEAPYRVLLLSVPDEENMSAGMRQAVTLLKKLQEKYQLQYRYLINSEPHERSKEKDGVVYTGSVGKLMPVIYVKGVSAHIGNVFGGINPITIAQQMISHIELNMAFCDQVEDEITLPPSVVYFRDRKISYNVSTPNSVGFYYSQLLLTTSIEEITHKLLKVAHLSSQEVKEKIEESYNAYCRQVGIKPEIHPKKIKVMLYGELIKIAEKKGGEYFKRCYQAYQEEMKELVSSGQLNLPESTFWMIEKVLEFVPDLEGAIIIAYAPPYYPSVHIENSSLVQALSQYAQAEWKETYEEKKYFMGISDMSYVGNTKNKETQRILQAHMPQWQKLYEIPFEDMEEISMPMINIGPWGKDLHQWSERVYRKDVLEHTPRLIWKILNDDSFK